ncbi:HK97 family phage prohead protease [Rhizobium rhizogenes]|uniref:HK97 family phage prohead protease n=1 Tax=Rhizobium rhizogenes TaxID=359 RepID=UPI0006740DCA
MTIEKRFASSSQKVAGRLLSGLAVPYNQEARIGEFTEIFTPGSMTRTLADRTGKRDVVAITDHDASALLGRVSSGTLKLTETARGVEFELELPPTSLGDEILALAQRGDLGGVSFGFLPLAEQWDGDKRVVTEADLYEISIVRAHSAYDNAGTLSVRSLQQKAQQDYRRSLYLHYLGGAR